MTVIQHDAYPHFHQIKHPVLSHKVSLLRQRQTNHKLFRELIEEIAFIIGYEATRHLSTQLIEIETPQEKFQAPFLKGPSPVIVPILRAGLGMVAGIQSLLPMASVGHIGLERHEKTFKAKTYYCKLPAHSTEHPFFICDPMLATGGSLIDAIGLLKEKYDVSNSRIEHFDLAQEVQP